MRAGKKNIELPTFEEVTAERKRLRHKMRYGRTLKSTVAVLVIAAAAAILVATLWLPVLQIYGNSMAPTLNDGQIIISVKSRHFSTGDVVAFYHGNKILVKRCIAGPSDWINIDKDGNIYVNDKKLDEPYVEKKAFGETTIDLPYQVPEDRWFLVGDNRSVSLDSRSTTIGSVPTDQIIGKIIFRIWPVNSAGLVNK